MSLVCRRFASQTGHKLLDFRDVRTAAWRMPGTYRWAEHEHLAYSPQAVSSSAFFAGYCISSGKQTWQWKIHYL